MKAYKETTIKSFIDQLMLVDDNTELSKTNLDGVFVVGNLCLHRVHNSKFKIRIMSHIEYENYGEYQDRQLLGFEKTDNWSMFKQLNKLFKEFEAKVDKKKDRITAAIYKRLLLNEAQLPASYFRMKPDVPHEVCILYRDNNSVKHIFFVEDKILAMFLLEKPRFEQWLDDERSKE